MSPLKNQLKTFALLGAMSALLVGMGALVAPGYLYLFGALALLMSLGAYFFSDRVVLRLHGAREIDAAEAPELHAMVAELAGRAEIPTPRLFVIAEPQANAFATGRDPAHGVVALTEGLLRLLDRRELRGVIAHELAHIKNRDVLVASLAAAGASIVTAVAQAVSLGALLGGEREDDEAESSSALAGLVVALVAPVAATLVQLGISRSREYLADATAARIAGDPDALASALLKLEQASQIVPVAHPRPATASLFIVNPLAALEGASRLFSTHPATAERVHRLRSLARGRRRPRRAPRAMAASGLW